MDQLWYKDAVIYGVDVDAFQDGNGDGIGDFRGLTDRLGYLVDLGVTCLWILPFYPSPDRDNGYDIRDYYGVDPRHGTLDDFITFLRKAGEHGIRVILDLVMNHTSDQHPWFQAARRDPRCRYHDYYVWTDSPPPTPPDKGNILEENTVWTYDEVAGAYYYHRFYHFEPELQFANPDVPVEMERVLDFWLSFEVAGFRVDAASHMIHKKGLDSTEPRDPHGILKELRRFVTERREGTVLLGEADVEPSQLADYIGEGDELNMIFNFLLNNYLYLALARQEAEPIARCLGLLPTIPQQGQWANFLRNLDEVDLERLTDEERQEVFAAFGPKPEMQIFGRGLRRRLAPMLRDRRQLEMAWSLLFSLPGTPMIVYGDEIGLGEDLSLDGRNAVRVPMQWSDGKNAGFSDAARKDLKRPVVTEGDFGYPKVNVAAQLDDPDSLLSHVKKLIAVRRRSRECGWGSFDVIPTDNPAVFAHWSKYQRDAVLTVHNLAKKSCTVTLDLKTESRNLARLHGNAEPQSPEQDTFRLRLPEYGYGWFRIEGT
jgi:maltose alpha-D-glucosyltransferase/alpha-amylase